MKSGVSFPTYTAEATFAVVSGAVHADYPIQNLGDTYRIRKVAKATGAGALSFTFVLSAARLVHLFTLLHHNGGVGDTARLRLYSDAGLTAQVHDTGALPLFPPGSSPSTLYPQNWPHKLPNDIFARAGRIDLSAHATGWVLGGFNISDWWEWTDITVPREFGVKPNDSGVDQPFASPHTTSVWSPRIISGNRSNVDQSEIETTAYDFFLEKKTHNPFVWIWDYDDVTTWAREVILVRNAALPPPKALSYPSGSFSFSFQEHLR